MEKINILIVSIIFGLAVLELIRNIIIQRKHERESGEILLQIPQPKWTRILLRVVIIVCSTLIFGTLILFTQLPPEEPAALFLPALIICIILTASLWSYSKNRGFEIREKAVLIGFDEMILYSQIKEYEWAVNLFDKTAKNILLMKSRKRFSLFSSGATIPVELKDTVDKYLTQKIGH